MFEHVYTHDYILYIEHQVNKLMFRLKFSFLYILLKLLNRVSGM